MQKNKSITKKISPNIRTFVTHEFPAFFNLNSEILILGTIPSPKSREQGFYYGHPQNRFWKVLAEVLTEPLPLTIDEKKIMLQKHKIALWDVLKSCSIIGASDTSIENVTPNDISKIILKTKINKILCTGTKAYKLYQKYCEQNIKIKAFKLPSTSPANCATSLEKLVESYKKAIKEN